jgi:hypothetical protein
MGPWDLEFGVWALAVCGHMVLTSHCPTVPRWGSPRGASGGALRLSGKDSQSWRSPGVDMCGVRKIAQGGHAGDNTPRQPNDGRERVGGTSYRRSRRQRPSAFAVHRSAAMASRVRGHESSPGGTTARVRPRADRAVVFIALIAGGNILQSRWDLGALASEIGRRGHASREFNRPTRTRAFTGRDVLDRQTQTAHTPRGA